MKPNATTVKLYRIYRYYIYPILSFIFFLEPLKNWFVGVSAFLRDSRIGLYTPAEKTNMALQYVALSFLWFFWRWIIAMALLLLCEEIPENANIDNIDGLIFAFPKYCLFSLYLARIFRGMFFCLQCASKPPQEWYAHYFFITKGLKVFQGTFRIPGPQQELWLSPLEVASYHATWYAMLQSPQNAPSQFPETRGLSPNPLTIQNQKNFEDYVRRHPGYYDQFKAHGWENPKVKPPCMDPSAATARNVQNPPAGAPSFGPSATAPVGPPVIPPVGPSAAAPDSPPAMDLSTAFAQMMPSVMQGCFQLPDAVLQSRMDPREVAMRHSFWTIALRSAEQYPLQFPETRGHAPNPLTLQNQKLFEDYWRQNPDFLEQCNSGAPIVPPKRETQSLDQQFSAIHFPRALQGRYQLPDAQREARMDPREVSLRYTFWVSILNEPDGFPLQFPETRGMMPNPRTIQNQKNFEDYLRRNPHFIAQCHANGKHILTLPQGR
ncbi:MAG: hypothetical protein Q4C96_03410 [Planctomycetia bacterium]|nr:hypothetical protein [Planctomycetia bacterium]